MSGSASRKPQAVSRLVVGSCRLKASIVAADEREGDRRMLLNFGHTFGHGYEKLSNYRMRHGQAVAAGMMAELRLSEKLAGLHPSVKERAHALLARLGVQTKVPSYDTDALVAAMRSDKKNHAGRFRLVLLRALGQSFVAEVKEKDIRAACE